MAENHVVTLKAKERVELRRMTSIGKTPARNYVHARILLLCDSGSQGPAWPDKNVCEALGITRGTVGRVKTLFAEGGLDSAVERKPHKHAKFAGDFEASVLETDRTPPPNGRARRKAGIAMQASKSRPRKAARPAAESKPGAPKPKAATRRAARPEAKAVKPSRVARGR